MAVIIKTKNLNRVYKTYEKSEGMLSSLKGFWQRKYVERTALLPTNLEIEAGQIIGLVGANGAGKTTLLKLLSGLIYPTSGTAEVLGFVPWERKNEYLRRMSILLGQKNQLWWDLAPNDSFVLLSKIYDLDKQKALLRVQELAELLDCKHVLETQLRRLSLGERMKMEIIGALLHSPDVLFLDEPTIGLDIVAQTTIRKFLSDYVREKGPTVILTSHYMDDIAKLADRLLLISKGSMVYDGTVQAFVDEAELKRKVSFSLSEALTSNLSLGGGLELQAGLQQQSLQVAPQDLSTVLAKVTALPLVQDLRIEEADFEDIVRTFMEKESRVLPSRNSVKS